jgi:hypothetical protein
MPLPRDFIDEVDSELREARRQLGEQRIRLDSLEELHVLASVVAGELGRPITVFDLIRSAPGRSERERRVRLVRELRR